MEAGIELQGGFHRKYSVHLGADELEEIFDAGVFQVSTVHDATNLLLLSYRFRLCQLMSQEYVSFC